MSGQYVVSTFSKQGALLKNEIWDADEPLGLGHPFQWVIEKTDRGIRLRDLYGQAVKEAAPQDFQKTTYNLGPHLKIKLTPILGEHDHSTVESPYLEPDFIKFPDEIKKLKKTLIGSSLGLTLALLLSIIIAKLTVPQEEPLIPPQFAKIILTPPRNAGQTEPTASSRAQESKTKQAINLIQTFKSVELKKTTENLVKGGILSALTKNSLLAQIKTNASVHRVFEVTPKSSGSSAKIITQVNTSLAVTSLGGRSDKGSAGAVGYSQGHKAGLQDQGNAIVSLQSAEATVEEGLTKDEVGKVIHSHITEVRYCYESAMLKAPTLQGKISIDFTIAGNGIVRTAKMNHSTVESQALEQCIVSHLTKWKFPKPKGGVNVTVSYPFIFKSL